MIEIASVTARGHGVGGAKDRGLAARPAALRDVRLTVEPGTICAVIGEESDGTALLLTLAAGRARPARGHVRVAGGPPERHRRSIAHVPASPSLPLELSVARALRLSESLRGEARRDATERLAPLALEHLAEARIAALSGDERRSVAVALAVTSTADVLLLEEPMRHLTASAAARLPSLLRARAEDGASILITTASASEARRVADHLFRLERGELRALDPSSRDGARPLVRVVLRDVIESDSTARGRFVHALTAIGGAEVVGTNEASVTVTGDDLDALARSVTAALAEAAVDPFLVELLGPSIGPMRAHGAQEARA